MERIVNREIKESKCRNCRYYLVHYVKSKVRLIPIDGHCINEEFRKLHPRRTCDFVEKCGFWEPMEIQIEERRRDIERVLEGMEQRLKDISLILKDDARYSDGK